jgi:hypothetical protein
MLCMLVLFPLGVLRMADAIQQDRCAQASRMATAIANFQMVRNDPWVLSDASPNCPVSAVGVTITSGGSGYNPLAPPAVKFSNPQIGADVTTGVVLPTQILPGGQIVGVTITHYGSGYLAGVPIAVSIGPPPPGGAQAAAQPIMGDAFTLPGGKNMLPADPYGPSYPVLVDPMGYFSAQGLPAQYWVSGPFGNSNTFARRTTSYALAANLPNGSLALRWNCLLDDIPFASESLSPFSPVSGPVYDVEPAPLVPGTFSRDIRYCWAYLLKRPRTIDRSVVDMSVVVYNQNRPILSSAFNEYLYQTNGLVNEVTFNPSTTSSSITIDVTLSGNVVPPARPGDWLLDASYVPNQAQTHATVNGYFYRVVGVTQNSDTSYTFAVQQPLRNMTATTAINPGTGTPYVWQKVIFLDGVVEVFEKGPGRLP